MESECLSSVLLNICFTAVLGTSPITTELSEGLLPEFIFFLVDLLRVDNLEFKTEFHLMKLARKVCEFCYL